jgi:hypothetical protein
MSNIKQQPLSFYEAKLKIPSAIMTTALTSLILTPDFDAY